ncbi:hypothetical protein KQX64_22800 [Rhodopseudomonas palustris]|nr:hypothetical protein KQX64_22800 [Rhodopseudomonas palustris]
MAESEIVKAARAEAERLKAKLASNPDYQKLIATEQLIDLYARSEQPQWPFGSGTEPGSREAMPAMSAALRDPSVQTKTAQIERVTVSFLQQIRRRATSGEILTAVMRAGIEIGGKEPNKALSAYLSGFKSLNNSREYGGYGLVEWGDGPGPKGVFD